MRICFFITGLFLIVSEVSAQYKVPKVNGWRVHLPYQTNQTMVQAGTTIYVGSTSGVFSYDHAEHTVDVMSRVSGLSDVEVSKLAYDEQTATLIIVYKSTNIDLVRNGVVYNISNILNQTIIGEKIVNDVTIYNGLAYLSCSFGIVKIDLEENQIVDSYQNIGPGGSTMNVSDIAVFNNSIYASSTSGLYRASLNSGNLSDFNFWSQVKNDSFYQMLTFGNFLLVANKNSINRYDGLVWDSLTGLSGSPILNLLVSQQKLLCIQPERVIQYDALFQPAVFWVAGVADGLLDGSMNYNLLIRNQGLVVFDPMGTRYIWPGGPFGNTAYKFTYASRSKRLFVAGGSVDGIGGSGGWKSSGNNNKYYVFDGNEWSNGAQLSNPYVEKCRDLMDVTYDERTDKAYFTSFGYGLLELSGLTPTQLYDTSNSSLGYFVNEFPGFRPVYAAGTDIDSKGNLWVTSYGAAKPLAVKSAAGQWYSFGFSGGNNAVGYIVCDKTPEANKWIMNNRGGGLYVYHEGASLASETDDRFSVLTTEKGKGALPNKNVLSMAVDQSGEMWIGTEGGLCIISNPGAVFKGGNYDARQLIFNTGSFNSIFLGTDAILCIKVDGANRKWIGTRNGVWLVSEDGYTVIRNFTMDNSPLLSDVVYDIGIFEETGEVFFATEKGIISYSGDATEGGDQHGNVFVYPNPVKPEYTGEIAIRGLAANTNVKVTDIAGNLVYETKANGGMATWNGKTFAGKRAATGVYLIYSSNDDATETYVTKLLFIN